MTTNADNNYVHCVQKMTLVIAVLIRPFFSQKRKSCTKESQWTKILKALKFKNLFESTNKSNLFKLADLVTCTVSV